ncbi:MAG: hypothetical protein MJ252_00740 [archaeon]|nr:hypothetical protein [archaeon]
MENNEIKNSLDPLEFWQYEVCEKPEININTFQGYKSKTTLDEDIKYFYNTLLGSAVHPSLVKAKLLINEELDNIREVHFNNIKVDKNTIKILFTLAQKLKIISLKFTNNGLDLEKIEMILNFLFTLPINVYSFSYEWNNLFYIGDKEVSLSPSNNKEEENKNKINEENKEENKQNSEEEILKSKEFILKLFNTDYGENQLEAVSLRGCFIGDELIIKVFEEIKKNEMTNLVVLNLFKNNLTNGCLKSLFEMLKTNQKLQEINLGGNFFDDEAITEIRKNVGLIQLDEEEVKKYKKLLKEKEEAEEWNKIKKNKNNQKPDPTVEEINIEEKNYYREGNITLRKIDLSQNNITQSSFENINGILNQSKEIILIFDSAKFNEDSINKFTDVTGIYIDRIILCK